MQQELTVNDKEINICGIDWSYKTDISIATVINTKTNSIIDFVKINPKLTTKEEREEIINNLKKEYNIKNVCY